MITLGQASAPPADTLTTSLLSGLVGALTVFLITALVDVYRKHRAFVAAVILVLDEVSNNVAVIDRCKAQRVTTMDGQLRVVFARSLVRHPHLPGELLMEEAILRELRDREAWALAVFGAAISVLIVRDTRIALIALAGTLTVRCLAGVVLHGTHPPPRYQFPDLTPDDTLVAWYVYRGRGDPAIARRTGLSLRKVRDGLRRIMRAWRVRTRGEIANHVADILGEAPVHRPVR